MAEILPLFEPGDRVTYTAGATIVGGQVLMVSGADNTVIPATAASTAVIGVAAFDAATGDLVGVHSEGIFLLTASGAVTRGDTVVAGAAGTVATAGAAPDSRTVVGRASASIASTAQGQVLLLL